MTVLKGVRPTGSGVIVVGLGDMRVSADPHDVLVTYALGSCLGVAIYDPRARVGGLLHAMMPHSGMDPARAEAEPAVFVDTGIPALFRACYAIGARKDRLIVRLIGAASIHGSESDQFQIGRRNLLIAQQLFYKNGVQVHAEDVGGTTWRNVTLHMDTGDVVLRGTQRQAPL
jgi:chemotaxis protein CheD